MIVRLVTTLLWLVVSTTSASSSTLSPYESVRALDQYGNAKALENARAASDDQGRLVIGLRHGEALWIVSPVRRSRHQRAASTSTPLVEWIHMPVDGDFATTGSVGMVCSGIMADARWLTRQAQTHAKQVWERYNGAVPVTAVAATLSRLYRRFWNYDESATWQSPVGLRGEEAWARPMGVRTLLVAPASLSLIVMEPSGLVGESRRLCCIGKHSMAVEEALSERVARDEWSRDELQEALREAIGLHHSTADAIVVEILHQNGTVEKFEIAMQTAKR